MERREAIERRKSIRAFRRQPVPIGKVAGWVDWEKAAAQSVPVIGAFGGALINTLFIDPFQDIREGHFTVRRLERKYGFDVVKKMYEQLPWNDLPPTGRQTMR